MRTTQSSQTAKESVKERKLRNTQEADKARRYKEANETLRLFWLSKE